MLLSCGAMRIHELAIHRWSLLFISWSPTSLFQLPLLHDVRRKKGWKAGDERCQEFKGDSSAAV